jgi:hypothetical protein
MHRDRGFLSCKPEARRQGFIEFNRCRHTAASADDTTDGDDGGDDPTSDIVDARPRRPSRQLG